MFALMVTGDQQPWSCYVSYACFDGYRGPAAMLLLSLGVVSKERFSCLELVKEYIRQKQLFEVNIGKMYSIILRK